MTTERPPRPYAAICACGREFPDIWQMKQHQDEEEYP